MAHIPVLLNEVVSMLSPEDGDRILDCTFGGGGHTTAILNSCNCYVFAIDRDPDAEKRSEEVKKQFGERFDFKRAKFSRISEVIEGLEKFDAALFDFGVSSFQIDQPDRGFSFSKDGPLDMRMSKDGVSAYEVVNSFSKDEISDIIYTYGNEHKSRKIADRIVYSRSMRPIETTEELREIINEAIGHPKSRMGHSGIDSATKTFQAFRIYVNDELSEIDRALKQLPKVLKNGARVATIAFHELEDRIVKNWAKSRKDVLSFINKSVIKPTRAEINKNTRARSAILRGFLYNDDGRLLLKNARGN